MFVLLSCVYIYIILYSIIYIYKKNEINTYKSNTKKKKALVSKESFNWTGEARNNVFKSYETLYRYKYTWSQQDAGTFHALKLLLFHHPGHLLMFSCPHTILRMSISFVVAFLISSISSGLILSDGVMSMILTAYSWVVRLSMQRRTTLLTPLQHKHNQIWEILQTSKENTTLKSI